MTFRNCFIKDYLTVLKAEGQSPLGLWRRAGKEGFVRKVWDEDLKTWIMDIRASNVSTCSIATRRVLGLSAPMLTLIIKNLYKYFCFEVEILDNFGIHRRLRLSNFQKNAKISTFDACIPLCMNQDTAWNRIRIDLAQLTLKAFNVVYVETQKITVHANCRIRVIYFTKIFLPDSVLPPELTTTPKYRCTPPCLVSAKAPTAPNTPPPSAADATSVEAFDYAFDDEEAEDFDFQLTAPKFYPSFTEFAESTSTLEGENATYTVRTISQAAPATPKKDMSTQTFDDFLPSPPEKNRMFHVESEISPEQSRYMFLNVPPCGMGEDEENLLFF